MEDDLLKRFKKINDQVKKRQFTIRDTGVSRRQIKNWEGKGLLPGYYIEVKREKFTLIELVWLKCVKRLINFGVPLTTIITVKNDLIQPVDENELVSISEVRKEIGRQHPELTRIEIAATLDEARNSDQLNNESSVPLCSIVLDCLLLKNHWAILVGEGGRIKCLKLEQWNKTSKIAGFNDLIYRSYVAVSVNEILAQTLIGIDLKYLENEYQLLTKAESIILSHIHSGNFVSLQIFFDDDQNPVLLESNKNSTFEFEAMELKLKLTSVMYNLDLKINYGQILYRRSLIRAILPNKNF